MQSLMRNKVDVLAIHLVYLSAYNDTQMFYSTEEAERERHRQALARARRSRERDLYGSGSIVGAASSVLRSLSSKTSGLLIQWNITIYIYVNANVKL